MPENQPENGQKQKIRARRMMKIGMTIFYIAAALFTLLMILEGRLRSLYKEYNPPVIEDETLGWRCRPGPFTIIFGESPWRPGKYSGKMNSRGFHDVEHSIEKPPGTYRILFLGDSFVQQWQLNQLHGFVRLIEERLNLHPDLLPPGIERVECINLGVGNYGLDQEYILLRQEGLAYEPDLVLQFVFLMNDYKDMHPELHDSCNFPKPFFDPESPNLKEIPPRTLPRHPKKEFIPRGPLGGLLFLRSNARNMPGVIRALEALRLYRLPNPLADDPPWIGAYRVDHPLPYWNQARELGYRLIKKTHDDVLGSGGAYGLVHIPGIEMYILQYRSRILANTLSLKNNPDDYDIEKPRRELREFCNRESISLLDLQPLLEEDYKENSKKQYFFPDGHFNLYGHALVSEWVADWVEQRYFAKRKKN